MMTGSTAFISENNYLRQALETIRSIVDAQANDEGLWFDAKTAPEAYLQSELRQLHACIERYTRPTVEASNG